MRTRKPSYGAQRISALAINTMNQSMGWMCVGLVVTAFSAFFISSNPTIVNDLNSNGLIFFGLIVLELLLVSILSFKIMTMSFEEAVAAFLLYSFLNGLSLSSIFLIYTSTSIVATFFITAVLFGAMALYGYTTGRDLTTIGSLAFMTLIGLVIASVVNIFLKSNAFGYILSYLSIIIFIGLTAYDAQKIKRLGGSSNSQNLGILGALTLYLDFINIFLDILRLFGRARND
jgi:FtsH-binding integral membrane protein